MKASSVVTTFGLVYSLSALAVPATVRGDIIVANLGGGIHAVGVTIDSVRDYAMSFTVSAGSNTSYLLTSVVLPLRSLDDSGGFGTLDVSIFSDSGGLPGTLLDTFRISNIQSLALYTATFSGGTYLEEAEQYWVVSELADGTIGDPDVEWRYASDSSGQAHRSWQTEGFHAWNGPYGGDLGMTVSGTPVHLPAPGAALLAMLGLPMIGWAKRRDGMPKP